MNKIKLHNRYNANIWIEHIDKDLWQLKSEKTEDLEYLRVGYEDDNKTINFIDPSGGPFMSVGYQFNKEYKLAEIFPNGFIFRLESI